MTEHAVLLSKIDKLSPRCFAKVIDFVEYLQEKTQNDHNDVAEYKAMAADTEREKEAQEWCNAYFGPVSGS